MKRMALVLLFSLPLSLVADDNIPSRKRSLGGWTCGLILALSAGAAAYILTADREECEDMGSDIENVMSRGINLRKSLEKAEAWTSKRGISIDTIAKQVESWRKSQERDEDADQ